MNNKQKIYVLIPFALVLFVVLAVFMIDNPEPEEGEVIIENEEPSVIPKESDSFSLDDSVNLELAPVKKEIRRCWKGLNEEGNLVMIHKYGLEPTEAFYICQEI